MKKYVIYTEDSNDVRDIIGLYECENEKEVEAYVMRYKNNKINEYIKEHPEKTYDDIKYWSDFWYIYEEVKELN